MATERPPIDSYFTSSIDKRPPINTYFVGDGRTTVLPPKREASIYRKGGIYDQFGPNPPAFNPSPGKMAGFVQAGADQPGSALPFVGQAGGGMAAGPVGGVGGAVAGEAVRQGLGRAFGVQSVPLRESGRQFGQVAKNAAIGEALGFGGGVIAEKGSKMLGPGAKNAAVRIAKNIIRPTGKYTKRGEKIATEALKEGVLRGSAEGTAKAAQRKIQPLMDEVNSIAASIKNKTMTAESGLRRMDALSKWYSGRGDSKSAARVLEIKDDIIRGERLMQPVFGEKETSQFVMGPASKQTTPQITETYSKDMTGGLKQFQDKARYESVQNPKTKKFQRSEPKREFLTPKTVVESPDDIVALNVPGGPSAKPRKIVSVSPKETFKLRPETKGVSKKETVQIGEKPREMSVKRGLDVRRGQDALLKTKKGDAGYLSDTNSVDIMARQEFTGGIRKDLAKASPEIAERNKRISALIDISKASGKRADVSSRNNLADLADSVIGTAAMLNWKALALLAGRKVYQGTKGAIARSLFGLPSSGAKVSQVLKNPTTRALFAQLAKASEN